MTHRLGVDVGGTFTDLLLINEETGATFASKCQQPRPTRPRRFGRNRARLRERGDQAAALTELMHGTTATTNAVLEGKGARVELVTTEGNRQILQVARSYVPGGLAGWIVWPNPEPLAALDDTVEVRERIGARGEVVRERMKRARARRSGSSSGARSRPLPYR
jgi:N-methylhydantoinase A